MTETGYAQRLDAHNTSVDDALALAGRCGVLHLPSGRRCPLNSHHLGPCTFVILDVGAGRRQRRPLGCVLGL